MPDDQERGHHYDDLEGRSAMTGWIAGVVILAAVLIFVFTWGN